MLLGGRPPSAPPLFPPRAPRAVPAAESPTRLEPRSAVPRRRRTLRVVTLPSNTSRANCSLPWFPPNSSASGLGCHSGTGSNPGPNRNPMGGVRSTAAGSDTNPPILHCSKSMFDKSAPPLAPDAGVYHSAASDGRSCSGPIAADGPGVSRAGRRSSMASVASTASAASDGPGPSRHRSSRWPPSASDGPGLSRAGRCSWSAPAASDGPDVSWPCRRLRPFSVAFDVPTLAHGGSPPWDATSPTFFSLLPSVRLPPPAIARSWPGLSVREVCMRIGRSRGSAPVCGFHQSTPESNSSVAIGPRQGFDGFVSYERNKNGKITV